MARHPDAFDMAAADENPDGEAGVICDRCGEGGLDWIDTGVRWRLIGPDCKPHVCKPSADDFDVIG